jgi:hypothetical protein
MLVASYKASRVGTLCAEEEEAKADTNDIGIG